MSNKEYIKRKSSASEVKSSFDHLVAILDKKQFALLGSNYSLPDPSHCFVQEPWKDTTLQELKVILNNKKSELNDFNLEQWSSHTRRMNPAGDICWRLKNYIKPEFVTQAWTKFYETVHEYNIVPENAIENKKLVSLHLCEAPGAFIAALNHYLKTHHLDINWQWRASTLNPYYEGNSTSVMINDDRFMFHTLDYWDFGLDETGDIMDWENAQSIVNNAKKLGEVLLVTADGSIDCIETPDIQEEVTSPLHYCEVVTALLALSPGGSFMYKLFTLFEHSSVCILYFVRCLFEKVYVWKPITSKQGNSEVYVVCENFKGYDAVKPYIPKLKAAFGTKLFKEKCLFPKDFIPTDFLQEIRSCAKFFSSIQCQVIDINIATYNTDLRYDDIKDARIRVAKKFVADYALEPIDLENEILKGKLHEKFHYNFSPKLNTGSFTDRQKYGGMSSREKFLELQSLFNNDICKMESSNFINKNVCLNTYSQTPLSVIIKTGIAIKKLQSSKFIYSPIFKFYQKIVAVETFRNIVFKNELLIRECSERQGVDQKCRFPDLDESTAEYEDYEKNCFKSLIALLNNLDIGDNLYLINMNLMTHFNVGVLHILANDIFECIEFKSGSEIVLKNLKTKLYNALDTILEYYSFNLKNIDSTKKNTILRVLPVTETNQGALYEAIILYNNTFYKMKCEASLNNIQVLL